MELLTGFVRSAATEQLLFAAGAIASRHFDDTVSSYEKTLLYFYRRVIMELLTGFEPVTSSLPRTCSTC